VRAKAHCKQRSRNYLTQSSTDTLKKKIFIETSALIAASVRIVFPEGEEYEDEFYKESTQLFDLIKQYFELRIGVTTKTVEDEAKDVLMNVVTSTIEGNAPEQAQSFRLSSRYFTIVARDQTSIRSCLIRAAISSLDKRSFLNASHNLGIYSDARTVPFFFSSTNNSAYSDTKKIARIGEQILYL